MLTRLDKVDNLKHSHNLWRVTFSNPSSAWLVTHADCEVASEQYRRSSKSITHKEAQLANFLVLIAKDNILIHT